MARHYSTRDFFPQIPNALLARYFHGRSLFGDLDFSALQETQPDDLFAVWLRSVRSEVCVRLDRQDGLTADDCGTDRRRKGKESSGGPNGAGCLAESKLGEPEPHNVPFPGLSGRELHCLPTSGRK